MARTEAGVPREADEQEALFRWAAYEAGRWPELRLLYHVPNGGSRNLVEAARLKAQGVRPGVPDICLPVARAGLHGLYIELKRRRGGRLSGDQRAWIEALRRAGYRALVCEGFDAARAAILEYLEEDET